MIKLKHILLICLFLFMLIIFLLGPETTTGQDDTYTINVLVVKAKVYADDGYVWIKAFGYYPVPCSSVDHGRMSSIYTNLSDYEHRVDINVSYPYLFEECLDYVHLGYYRPLDKTSAFKSGRHLFWVNGIGAYFKK